MPRRTLHVIVPGDIETRTGGYGYDRQIVAGLRRRGWVVHVTSLPGNYPQPGDDDRASAAHLLAALPDDACVLVDGLAFGALPAEANRERSRVRFIALVHHPLGLETGIDEAASTRLLAFERSALTAARGVVVTSRLTVNAVEALGVERLRIAVVEPGTDPAPAARGSGGSSMHLLCIASLVPRKGHDTLFDALERIVHLDWRLTCVGSADRDSSYAAMLAHRAASVPLQNRVAMTGELAGAPLDAAYDAADLFVLPTRYEGYGMAVAEALARGVPVVSTATGAIADLVAGDAGLLVPPDDPASLAAGLARVMSDRSLLARLRSGAMRAGRALPTWDTACVRMEEALARFDAP